MTLSSQRADSLAAILRAQACNGPTNLKKKTQSKKLHFQAVIKARLDHGSKVVLFDSSHGLKILLQWSH